MEIKGKKNEEEKERRDRSEERKRKAHNFIEAHKEDRGGESVASSSGAFDCSHH